MSRRFCLAIGVANAKTLEYLPGAANSAQEMAEWACAAGFDKVSLFTDEARVGSWRWTREDDLKSTPDAKSDEVTVQRIGDELEALLNDNGDEIDFFLLHFAGHGFRRGGASTLWVPTNWKKSLRVVAVELLKFRLEAFGIRNLTIVSDACLNFIDNEVLEKVTDDGVLGEGTTDRADLALDRFNAIKDGESAFMVKAEDPQNARCILSGVLVDALWGHEDEAFDKYVSDRITSGSLCEFLPGKTEQVGLIYHVNSKAEVFQGQPREHVIYLEKANVTPPPARRIWPPPVTSKVMAYQRFELPHRDHFGSQESPDELHGWSEAGRKSYRPRPHMIEVEVDRIETDKSVVRIERDIAGLQDQANAYKVGLVKTSSAAPNDANLVLNGGEVVNVWSRVNARRVRPDAWLVPNVAPAIQVIVEFEDELFVPVVVYRHLQTFVTHGAGSLTGWAIEEQRSDTDRRTYTADVISRVAAGLLEPSDVDSLAVEIRKEKHVNPVLGAIAAYLYDYIGDRDNIRRMAWYYYNNGQPVPYDIAFLGAMQSWRDRTGEFHVRIPAVPKREAPGLPEYSTRATTEILDCPVAGYCPWLRQGWDFAAAPENPEKPLVTGYEGMSAHLKHSVFSALDREGAFRLIQQWELEKSEG